MLQSRTASLLLVGLVLGICLTQTATAQELTREIVINIPEFTLYLYEKWNCDQEVSDCRWT